MMGRLQSIADNIKAKLPDHPSAIKEIEQRLRLFQELKGENADACIHFLLKTACEFNLLEEIHDLLELNLFKNIDQPLAFDKKERNRGDNGKTLLGLAAFHGHYELVSYLVEVRKASVNAKDMSGNTPLHQVVYGDSHPFNHSSYGTAHDRVAKYLVRRGGDLSIKNNEEKTPHDNTKWCAPLKVEDMLGRRFITNTGSAAYYGDKVRPIFEKKLARLKRDRHLPVTRIGGERDQAKDFKQFCLEYAVEEYVKNNKKAAFGYSSIEELYKALDSLSEEKWKHMRMVISSLEPARYSFKYGPISDQLPRMGKQSAMVGLMIALLTYYETQSILLSVGAGSISAVLAWTYLTERAYKQKVNEKSVKHERVSDLRRYDRFFKSPERLSRQQRQQLSNIQLELGRALTSTSGSLKRKFS